MKTATISTLKAKLSEHIALVKRGEEVLITERGKPVARIVPISPDADEDSRIQRLIKRGAIRPGKGISKDLIARLPVCRMPAGTAERLINEDREERF